MLPRLPCQGTLALPLPCLASALLLLPSSQRPDPHDQPPAPAPGPARTVLSATDPNTDTRGLHTPLTPGAARALKIYIKNFAYTVFVPAKPRQNAPPRHRLSPKFL